MFRRHKVIAVTPAGRRKYLALQMWHVFQAMKSGLVDEWHLWQNTGTAEEIEFLHYIQRSGAERNLAVGIQTVDSADPFLPGRIRNFFPFACEPGVVYVRFDDDLVWLEYCAIERLLTYRLANPDYFIVGGNVVNNNMCAYRHQQVSALSNLPPLENHFVGNGMDFGVNYHSQLLACPDPSLFYFPDEVLPQGSRFGIQFISWLGDEFVKFGGKIPTLDEENWLTREAPLQFGKQIALCGNALAAHFAYNDQRERGIYSESLLERYAARAPKQ